MSAALPLKVFPPLFNRYSGGDAFGSHVDNAIRQVPGSPHRVRTDLSATLFFVDPDGYDGGELVVEDTYGSHRVKLPAGDMVLYPSTSLHHVTPVTAARASARSSGSRAWSETTAGAPCSSTWTRRSSGSPATFRIMPSTVQLTGVYHNLLRQWSEL